MKELCAAFCEFGLPTYFLTLTNDQTSFPGVKEAYETIIALGLSPNDCLPFMQRVWHRSVELFFDCIRNDPSQPCGNVRHLFYRHEFQPDVGNTSHVHCFIWTQENMAETDPTLFHQHATIALSRITATIPGAFDYVDDLRERKRLETLAFEKL